MFHAHVARVQTRTRRAAVLMMLAGAAVAACDQPTQPHTAVSGDAAFSANTTGTTTLAVDCSASPLAGVQFIDLTVRTSAGPKAVGAVVAVLSPTHGVLCSGATDANGNVRFNGLAAGAAVVLSVRDEVSPNAVALEIVPPNPVAAPLLADLPTDAGNRQEPALLGGATCADLRALTWTSWVALKATPCIIPATGLTTTVKLVGSAPTITTKVLDASNQPLAGVIVAALSPATTTNADLPGACAGLPWIDQVECRTNSNGPALLQSLGLTGGDGRIALGVTFGPDALNREPVVIETIAEEGGQTLFGTLVQTEGGEQALLTAPGMCTVTSVLDSSEPAGFAELDIRSSAHSVGLSTSITDPAGAPFAAPSLVPVNGTLVVKLHIHASMTGGTGEYTMQYRLNRGGMNTVRASFAIGAGHPETCVVGAASGSGVGGPGAPEFVGHCAPNTTPSADLGSGRRAYTLFFVLSGMDAASLVSAQYDIRTDHDHLDPSRSVPEYLRGAVNFTGLNATSCPVRLNNDGRWLTV